ncbi:divalent-cation tolerance protein CutA [candidate division WOR-3 bacterium]|nr:divalent-cation tolerance protein CutA [candidate division WOR-3 bacterium]
MFLEVHTSFSNLSEAKLISRKLVEEHLAACANLMPACSIYRWKGKLEETDEVIVIFKTDNEHYPKLEARLNELHSYEVPMITVTKIETGYESYLSWMGNSLRKEE